MKNNMREADIIPRENVPAMRRAGRLSLVDEEGECFPVLRQCYGHTPGLMIPVIRCSDKTLVYTGDLIPTAAHIP